MQGESPYGIAPLEPGSLKPGDVLFNVRGRARVIHPTLTGVKVLNLITGCREEIEAKELHAWTRKGDQKKDEVLEAIYLKARGEVTK